MASFGGERQDLLDARGVGNVADHLLVGPGADLLLDFHADGFEVEPHFLQDVHRHALAEFDQAKQQVLGAHEIVVEPVGFLARQRQHLLGARREIVHGFVTHTYLINAIVACFVQRFPARASDLPGAFPSHR